MEGGRWGSWSCKLITENGQVCLKAYNVLLEHVLVLTIIVVAALVE